MKTIENGSQALTDAVKRCQALTNAVKRCRALTSPPPHPPPPPRIPIRSADAPPVCATNMPVFHMFYGHGHGHGRGHGHGHGREHGHGHGRGRGHGRGHGHARATNIDYERRENKKLGDEAARPSDGRRRET